MSIILKITLSHFVTYSRRKQSIPGVNLGLKCALFGLKRNKGGFQVFGKEINTDQLSPCKADACYAFVLFAITRRSVSFLW